jgi:Uma2 family endonuclease
MSAVPAPTPKRFTSAEYYKLGELGFLDERVELIDGEIIEMPPIGPEHAYVSNRLGIALQKALSENWSVRFGTPLDLEDSQPQPDVAVVGSSADHRHSHPTMAVLVVEISQSSASYDRYVKTRLYAKAGIPEYWLVDVARRHIEIYRGPIGDRYHETAIAHSGDQVFLAAEPGIVFKVDDLI